MAWVVETATEKWLYRWRVDEIRRRRYRRRSSRAFRVVGRFKCRVSKEYNGEYAGA